MATEEEEIIVGRCLKGEEKYQHLLYKKYYGKMMSVCLRYAKDREEAKDILHEGYIKVFQHLHEFKKEGSLEGWIRRIMVNTAINHYHKNSKLRLVFSMDDSYEEIAENNYTEDDIMSMLRYDDLMNMIQGLSPAYRTIFNLYVIEGYNHKEIAEMLQINEGTSKSNLAKARLRLQQQISALLTVKNAPEPCHKI